MSDEPAPTLVCTDQGELSFQQYFVRQRCQPRVKGFHFEQGGAIKPAPGVLRAMQVADLIVFCPSNPFVSIGPILAIPGVREELSSAPGHPRAILAVSPIIRGTAVKGPAAKMFSELGIEPSALAVARHYGARRIQGLLDGFVLDELDGDLASQVEALGIKTLSTQTWMKSTVDRRRLAERLLDFGKDILSSLQD
jgi:LPPG:FO 2-phospho-L-lactate transferase